MNTENQAELEAVNSMLRTIGEQPVNSLELSGVVEVGAAKACLQKANRDVQAKGWHFNTEVGLTLTPGRDGYIYLPNNCLRIDTIDPRLDLVQRGGKLYDRKAHSYMFDKPVVVDMIVNLGFDELPEYAKNYILAKATRKFQEGSVGSTVIEQFTQADEFEAKVDMESADAENADYNILTDNRNSRDTLMGRYF